MPCAPAWRCCWQASRLMLFEVVLRDKTRAHAGDLAQSNGPLCFKLPMVWFWRKVGTSWHGLFSHNDDFGWWHRAQTPDNRLMVALNDGVFKYHLDRYKYPERWAVTDRSIHRDHASEDLLEKSWNHGCKYRPL